MRGAGFRPVLVTSASALTAAGDDVDQTCTSIRAGICAFKRHARYVSEPGPPPRDEPMRALVAPVSAIDPGLGGPERLYQLAVPVLRDLVERAGLERRDLAECALLLALPSADGAALGWQLGEAFVAELVRRAGMTFARTGLSRAGHAGMLELVAEGGALLASERVRTCIVAGVDSYLSADRLVELDAAYRLKSPRNVDGMVPGEAATALLIEAAQRRRPRAAPLGRISAVGFGEEPETQASRSDKQSTGAGLCAALRAAAPPSCPWVLCDLNGESYRAFEWGVARTRLGEAFGALRKVGYPAASIGDVGAATGGVLVASALAAFRRGYAAADQAVIWAASDGPLRAAARVGAPE